MALAKINTQNLLKLGTALMVAFGCTQNIPEAYHYQQQEEYFGASAKVNTKIDLLWVIDNSASMDSSQEKLRNGFASFATKYLKPTWDIRLAVITTDTFLANSAFQTYLLVYQIVQRGTHWPNQIFDLLCERK